MVIITAVPKMQYKPQFIFLTTVYLSTRTICNKRVEPELEDSKGVGLWNWYKGWERGAFCYTIPLVECMYKCYIAS